MLHSALRLLMRDICNTDIFALQADQSGTIAEILMEDGKPVSIDTVFSLSTLTHPYPHPHPHTNTRTFTYTKLYAASIYLNSVFILAASFCHCTLSY